MITTTYQENLQILLRVHSSVLLQWRIFCARLNVLTQRIVQSELPLSSELESRGGRWLVLHPKDGTSKLSRNFRLLWPCIMNVGWRERNQQDATNLMFIIKLLSQRVSGIIMPIIRRTRVCTTAYGVLHCLWWLWLCGAGTRTVCTVKVIVRLCRTVCTVKVTVRLCRTITFTVHTARVPAPYNHSYHNQCRTPYAVVHNLVLLMMGIMMPETCWDKSLIINIRLVASCWFLSLRQECLNYLFSSSSTNWKSGM